MKNKLIRSQNVIWEELNDAVLVIDPSTGARWVLNARAAAMWKMCDGCALLADHPSIISLGIGASSRKRPSPRGNSGPG